MKVKELHIDAPGTAGIVTDSLVQGHNAVVAFGSVYAWIGDAYDTKAVSFCRGSKPRKYPRPFGIQGDLGLVPTLIDLPKVQEKYIANVMDVALLRQTFGNTSFLRLPIHTAAQEGIPKGKQWLGTVQIFSFWGNRWAHDIEKAAIEALQNKYGSASAPYAGIIFITSANRSGQPSITSADSAKLFCQEMGIEICVHNNLVESTGSYSITKLSESGIEITREGTGATHIRKVFNI